MKSVPHPSGEGPSQNFSEGFPELKISDDKLSESKLHKRAKSVTKVSYSQ